MKEFNLEAALAGEPVILRQGSKAYVVGKIPSNLTYEDNELIDYPLIGVVLDETGYLTGFEVHWTINGKVFEGSKMHGADIICMWEDPKISVGDLPKPFKPKDGEPYFYITGGIVEYEDDYWDSNKFDKSSAERGGCYRTREDAQKWLDFMKSMME